MDRQLLERLIGAGVLVAALVIVVPTFLDGGPGGNTDGDPSVDQNQDSDVSTEDKKPRRTHTIRLDRTTETPPVAREVTEFAADSAPEPAKLPVVPDEKPKVAVAATLQPAKPAQSTPVSTKPVVQVKPKPAEAPDPPPVKPAAVPKTGWVVQLGSFSSKQNAQRLADEVNGRGFSVFVMPLDRSGKKLYRVRVGPRDTREQAAELAGRLAKVGYSGQVTRQHPDA